VSSPIPPQRRHNQLKKSRQRDTDLAARARNFRAMVGAVPGAILGFIGGFRAMIYSESALAPFYPFIGLVIGAIVVFTLVMIATGTGGRAAAVLYNPSGKTTPRKAEYSQAQSLEARGMYQQAVDACRWDTGARRHPLPWDERPDAVFLPTEGDSGETR